MTPDYYRRLFDYSRWADARTFDAISSLSPGQFSQEVGGSFKSVRDTMAHVVGVEKLYLDRWSGHAPTSIAPGAEFSDAAALKAHWEEVNRGLEEVYASLTPESIAREIGYKNIKGEFVKFPLWVLLTHLTNHSSYHRGQVTSQLRQLGAKALPTDFYAWYAETRR